MDESLKTQPNKINLSMCYVLETVKQKQQREERESTKRKKKLFLEYYAKSDGVVAAVCEKTGINRWTYYSWLELDKEFARRIEKTNSKKNQICEEILWELIKIKKDGPSVRYHLDRRHPLYKPVSKTEVVTGDRTLEDLIIEHDKQIKKQQDEYDNQHKTPDTDEPRPNSETTEDTKQEGPASELHTEPLPDVLLEQKDSPEHNNQGQTAGAE